ncbi:DUF6080 domain-containing protein [Prevotella sp. AGR2160]|uniref:DUF6080 domain-containing protein n=1 Tax=Prevotella sp. AGR2160 TaxID=1280674 RepID=UPI00048CD7C3|nr:DUF6080 domain-containing protein [Prevotella sp. AGR2160]
MRNPFHIFAIRKDERWLTIIATLILIALNGLLIYNHSPKFLEAKWGRIGGWSLFNNQLHLSGYDPYAYMTLTKFNVYYSIDRHPVLTLLLYPFSVLNHWIMTTWNVNAAMYIMAALVIIAGLYAAIFMYRTLHELMNVQRSGSIWLTALLFSFASIMTTTMSPDHFVFSFSILVFTLYVFGRYIRKGKPIAWYKGAILYYFTTGITLTNGAKTLLGALFVDKKKAFSWKNILLGFLLPTVLLVGTYVIQNETLIAQRDNNAAVMRAKMAAKDPVKFRQDSIRDAQNAIAMTKINGHSVSDKPFLRWINADASRWNGIVEGLFGESIQLHQDYLLGDVFLGRPIDVTYSSWINYVVETIVFLLFMAGICCGYKDRILQMLLSWFAIDLLIHVVLGFGLNEVAINGGHWMFIIPVALACLLRKLPTRYVSGFSFAIKLLTVYLWGYNGYLIAWYMV